MNEQNTEQTSRETKPVTLRIAMTGPPGAGTEEAMRALHSVVPADQRGELVKIPSGDDELLGLDLYSFNLYEGDVPVIIRMMANPGESTNSETMRRLFSKADGILFFAGYSSIDDINETRNRIVNTLEQTGRDPDAVPFVVTASDGQDTGPGIDELAERLNVQPDAILPVEPETGRGVFHALHTLIEHLVRGVDSKTVQGLPMQKRAGTRAPDDSDLFMPDDKILSRDRDKDEEKRPGLFGLFGRKKK